MSGYGDIIKKGREEEKQKKTQKTVNTASGKSVKDDRVDTPPVAVNFAIATLT